MTEAEALRAAWGLFFALTGACVGSFLNVCILRLPMERSVVRPPSSCPHCFRRLNAVDLVPVIGWFLRLGRCASCKARISPRYPFVEALTAALWYAAHRRYGLTPDLGAALYLLSFLVVVAFIDIDWHLILDRTTYPTLALGLALSVLPLFPLHTGGRAGLERAIAGAVVGGGIVWTMGRVGTAVYRKEAMGLGDVKMLAALGAFLGPLHAASVIFLGAMIGGVVGIGLLAAGIVERRGYVPFGPFLAAAAVVDVLWWDRIDLFLASLFPIAQIA